MKVGAQSTELEYLHVTIDVISTILIVGCPVFLYMTQYFKIRRSGVVGSFSPFVSFVILFGSVFRILYWWAEPFEMSVLFQGFALFSVQLFLLNAVVNARKNTEISDASKIDTRDRIENWLNFSDLFNPTRIWRWGEFHKYVQFVMLIGATYAMGYYLLWNPILIHFTGYLSNTFDA